MTQGAHLLFRNLLTNKGYLRCGQIVQLMGQREKALDILERGLHKVPVGNDEDRKVFIPLLPAGDYEANHLKTLSKHYEALRRQFQIANRLDPLTRLPQETVQQIWDLLDLKSRG